MDNINGDMSQKQYWSMMEQFKFNLFFFEINYKNCILFERYFKCFIGCGTVFLSSFLAIIKNNEVLSIVCLSLITLIQAIGFAGEYLPYNQRKVELREMCEKLQPVYDNVEKKWREIAAGNCDTNEIFESIDEFKNQAEKIKDNYLKNDCLRSDKKSIRYAKKNADIYFDNFIKAGEYYEQGKE